MPAGFARRPFLRLLAGLGFMLPAAGLSGRPASAAIIPVGSVTKVKGTASVRRNSEQIALKPGEKVAAGDVVTTLAESRLRIELIDGSQLNLGELTRLVVAQFDFTPETLARAAAFDLKSGLCQAVTAKASGGSSFTIRTRNAVAATRSTDWIVEAKQAETSVFVLEGKVDVAESAAGFRNLSSAEQDKAMLLSAGQFTTVGKRAPGAGVEPKRSDSAHLAQLKAGLALD
jgi:hypothetical protein